MDNITGRIGGVTGGGTTRVLYPQAKEALNRMKFEVASQLGVNLTEGYNGNIKAKDAGSVGGNMVRRMIEQVERQMSGR